jgi:hypothetical protein
MKVLACIRLSRSGTRQSVLVVFKLIALRKSVYRHKHTANIAVYVTRVHAYSGGTLARAQPRYLFVDLSLAELRPEEGRLNTDCVARSLGLGHGSWLVSYRTVYTRSHLFIIQI